MIFLWLTPDPYLCHIAVYKLNKYKLKRSWGGQLTEKTILTHVHMFSKAGPTGLHKPAFVLDMFSGLLCLYEQHIDGTGEKNVQKERVNDM